MLNAIPHGRALGARPTSLAAFRGSETYTTGLDEPSYSCRKSKPSDIPSVKAFVTKQSVQIFQSCDPGAIMEKSVFSITAIDSVVQWVIGHGSFYNSPRDESINLDGTLWKTNESLSRLTSTNTLFLAYFGHHSEYESQDILKQLLIQTFVACPEMEHVVLEVPLSYSEEITFLDEKLWKQVSLQVQDKSKKQLFVLEKAVWIPTLTARPGRESDLDDLTGIINIDDATLEECFGKKSLPAFLSMNERHQKSMAVAHNDDTLGLINVTTRIDCEALNELYHLEAFHGLRKAHKEDSKNAEYVEAPETPMCPEDPSSFVQDNFDKTRTRSGPPDSGAKHDQQSPGPQNLEEPAYNQLQAEPPFHSRIEPLSATKLIPTVDTAGEVLRGEIFNEEDAGEGFGDFEHGYHSFQQGNFDTLPEDDLFGLQKWSLDEITNYKPVLRHTEYGSEFSLMGPESGTSCHSYKSGLFVDSLLSMCYPAKFGDVRKQEFHGKSRALSICVCAIHEHYRSRISTLLQSVFVNYPKRDYLMVTMPRGHPLPFWTQYFVKAVPRKSRYQRRELFVLQKSVWQAQILVRKATESEACKVAGLLGNMWERKPIIQDFCRAVHLKNLCGNTAHAFVVIANFQGESKIIGAAVISDINEVDNYYINYNVDSFVYDDLHDTSEYGYVHHFVLVPAFKPRAKAILTEILRLLKKSIFFHKAFPPTKKIQALEHQTLVNNMDDWLLVSPRPRIDYTKLGLDCSDDNDRMPPPAALDVSEPHALLMYSKKFTFDPKWDITAKIVFVGASQTSLACLAKLISAPHLNFSHLTLISPEGIPGTFKQDYIKSLMFPRVGGPSLSMDSDEEWHERSGLHLKLNVIHGKVTGILRDQKLVIVNDSDVVEYDYLYIAVGRQFVRPDCAKVEIVDTNFDQLLLSFGHVPEQKKEETEKPLRRSTKRPKNIFTLNSEYDAVQMLHYIRAELDNYPADRLIVHGACLEAYCCINALLKMGIKPERILFVKAGGTYMDWEAYQPFKDTRTLRNTMLDVFEELNITTLCSCEFSDWAYDVTSNSVTSVTFKGSNCLDEYTAPCFVYVGFAVHRISDEFLSAVSEAFLVVNDGIAVDDNFRTVDPCISAAGPCSTYALKYMATEYSCAYYNSGEVGQHLADIILKEAESIYKANNATESSFVRPPLPLPFQDPIARYAELPGGWFYLHFKKPGNNKNADECQKVELETGSVESSVDTRQRYFRLVLDESNRVEEVECMTREPFAPWNILRLFGMHETLLNNLLEKYDSRQIGSLYDFFQFPWASAIYLDRWRSFKENLALLYSTAPLGYVQTSINDLLSNFLKSEECQEEGQSSDMATVVRSVMDSSGIKSKIETKLVEFIQHNKRSLPMYAHPAVVRSIMEEVDRKTSRLMEHAQDGNYPTFAETWSYKTHE